jgi:hypothetical protein
MQGGIGNQLFCLYAGRFAANNSKSELDLDLAHLGKAATSRTFDLGDLEFPFSFNLKDEKSGMFSDLFFKVLKRSRHLSKLANLYNSPVVGFDKHLLTADKPLVLNGYFQTYEYVSRVSGNDEDATLFKLRNAGTAYQDLEKRISELNPVVIHIRRGDYLDKKNITTIGALSDDYFIGILKLYYPERPIWVFSNDRNLASFSVFPNLEVISTGELTDLEELILMSKASDLVISNSTFSWWSGFLSKGSVIAPAKWFRGLNDPENLCPESWLRVNPDWM